ncbi:metalloregulator ArsR/SmtB family transcription factor [Reinekea marinisedimentorum]
MKTILFLCTENSARSQIAEAVVNGLFGDKYQAFSAGTNPGSVDPRAIEALEKFGLPTDNLVSKSVDTFIGRQFDYTVTLCDKAQQECLLYDFGGERMAWHFEDPKTRAVKLPFETTLKELNERFIMFKLVKEKQPSALSISPLSLFKCLADETRLLMAALISAEIELCVCELTAALELSQPKISRHLAQMRDCGLLASRREGQWVYYQINPALPDWVSVMVKNTQQQMATDIEPLNARLNAMASRPERKALCAAC